MPTRGLEPPHPFRAIDPKSIASANSATSAHLPGHCSGWKRLLQILGRRHTPDSVGSSSRTVIYLSRNDWRFVACWVLPNFTRTAATRSHRQAGKTLSPCSQLHARPADGIATWHGHQAMPQSLVGSYPTVSALTRSQACAQAAGGYAFCCGCSHGAVTSATPSLTVS